MLFNRRCGCWTCASEAHTCSGRGCGSSVLDKTNRAQVKHHSTEDRSDSVQEQDEVKIGQIELHFDNISVQLIGFTARKTQEF